MNIKWLCIVAGAMALLAILPNWPYSYYQLLRIVLCVISVIVAYGFYSSKLTGWSLVFAVIVIIFNPIAPIYMTKSSWVGIDFVVGVLFLLASQAKKHK